MYEAFYGMEERPFSLAPDTQFFFNHQGHQDALNVLMVALDSGEGFVKITGEVGTGKTLLCRELLNRLGEEYYTAYIPNPYLSPLTLRVSLAEELGVDVSGLANYQLVNKIYDRLIEISDRGGRVVVCLDEVQAMPDNTLEALRLLTNLETEKRKLLQVVLFGQPELNEKLATPHNRQLLQRIIYSFELRPLDRNRMAGYIDHRLRISGYNGDPLFMPEAIDYLYQASKGIPRLVNILCNKALMLAFGRGDRQVGSVHMHAAIEDTEGLESRVVGQNQVLPLSIGVGSLLLLASVMIMMGR